MRKRYYIGLATTLHDSALAIVDDNGKVLFAEAAERRYQIKRALGCVPDNIVWAEDLITKYCTPDADYIITRSWNNRHARSGKMLYASGFMRFILNERIRKTFLNITHILPSALNNAVFAIRNGAAMSMNAGASMERAIRNQSNKAKVKIIAYDHHLSHAGLACYGSPFHEAVCFVADGEGEDGPFSIYKYKDGKISLLEKQKGPVSLGSFYQGLTFFCGFDLFKGEEWKVMGMAAYGSFNKTIYDLFTSMYYVDECRIKYRKNKFDAHKIYKTIEKLAAVDPKKNLLKSRYRLQRPTCLFAMDE